MSIAAVYADDLSRVRITCTGAAAHADYAVIERSADGITWSVVRGGNQVPLVAGACSLDDYEFAASVSNTYRATYVDSASPSVITPAAVASGDNVSLIPALPAGLVDGDLLLLKAAIRSTSASVNTPAGWALWVDGGNFRVFARSYAAGVVAPTVTFAGGAAGDDTVARILAVRNAEHGNTAWQYQSNASAQDIAVPGVVLAGTEANLVLRIGWKQSTATSSTLADWTFISRDSVIAGNDETVLWYQRTTSTNPVAGAFVMSGGVAAVSKAATMRLTRAPYVLRETANVTPGMDRVWLKNPQRPYLNRPVTVVDWSTIQRPARSGVFEVVGRSAAVAVTELRGGKRYTLTVTTTSLDQAADFDGVLSAGEPVHLHVPAGCPFPGGYWIIADTGERRPAARRSVRRYVDLPLVEVAAPDGTIVGATITWQGVINTYATWADLIAAEPTWSDVLDSIGTPADVVVP
jgi:hypothetical protein